MMPQTLEEQIDSGVKSLKSDGVVAYPTDTVYGLGANAFSSQGIDRIFQIKGRPRNMAMPLLIANKEELSRVAINIPKIVNTIVEHFWPGALTIILEKSPDISDMVSRESTIAVRLPNHPVPIALINGLGSPITGTSANFSSEPPATTSDDVRKTLGHKLDCIIDEGPRPYGVESTILDLTTPSPRIVREGAITRQAIEKVCKSALP